MVAAVKDSIFELCDLVRESAFSLHRHLRHGHLEKVYENGLAHRLRKLRREVFQQHPLRVLDVDGTLLGEFYADLLVDRFLVVKLKASRCIVEEHVAQLIGYLRTSRMEHGLLINFGAPILEVRKFVLTGRD